MAWPRLPGRTDRAASGGKIRESPWSGLRTQRTRSHGEYGVDGHIQRRTWPGNASTIRSVTRPPTKADEEPHRVRILYSAVILGSNNGNLCPSDFDYPGCNCEPDDDACPVPGICAEGHPGKEEHDHRRAVWVLLGLHKGWWAVLLATVVILYNAICGFLTLRISGPRDAEERSSTTPTLKEYFGLYRLCQGASVLLLLAFAAVGYNTYVWVVETWIWVPKSVVTGAWPGPVFSGLRGLGSLRHVPGRGPGPRGRRQRSARRERRPLHHSQRTPCRRTWNHAWT